MNKPRVYTVTLYYKNGAALSQPIALGPVETLPMEEIVRRAVWAYRYSDHTPDDDYFACWAIRSTVEGEGDVYTLTPDEHDRACAPTGAGR